MKGLKEKEHTCRLQALTPATHPSQLKSDKEQNDTHPSKLKSDKEQNDRKPQKKLSASLQSTAEKAAMYVLFLSRDLNPKTLKRTMQCTPTYQIEFQCYMGSK